MPDVSVVMAVRDGGSRLERTLHSVLAQGDVDFEVVVVDDGSVDATPRILHAHAAADPRLRVLRNGRNLGLTRSLIVGCHAARGRFIARQDCGDRSLPGRLSRQARLLEANPELAFVSCWTRYCDVDGRLLYEARGTGRAAAGPTDIIDLGERWGTADGPTHHGAVMFRTGSYFAAGGYRAPFYYGQDWDLWYRLAEAGRFQMLPESLYEATVAPDDLSVRNRRRQYAIARCSRWALELRQRGMSDAQALAAAERIPRQAPMWERVLARGGGHYFIGECLRRNGDRVAARKHLLQSIRQNPLQPKYWLRFVQAVLA